MIPSSVGAPQAELDRVRTWFENEITARVTPLLEYATALVGLARDIDSDAGAPVLSASAVEGLNPTVEAIIDDSPTTIGAGFIAGPDIVDARDRYMLWLQRRNGAIRRLRLNFDTTDMNAYDYVHMDWYVRTRDRRRPTLTGPYLDYSGSDALVLTVAVPVVADEEFLGVVALDLMAQAAEELMTSQLCGLPGEVVVVNRDRTVVATNSVRWMPGERLRVMPDQEPDRYESIVPIRTLSDWQLAVAKPQSA
ncbi:PDC sensor domain-containing protein [Spirillospora sp. CA-255316]